MSLTKKQIEEWDSKVSSIQSHTAGLVLNESYIQKHKTIDKLLNDPVIFKQTLFPHYAKLPDSRMHKLMNRELARNEQITQFRIAFRGFAKSVDADIIMPLFLMLRKQNPVSAIVGENFDKSTILLGDCQAELEGNELLLHYFGKQVGFGAWSDGEFFTKSGSMFKSFGINQSLSGIRYKENRLSYCSADDFDTHTVAGNRNRVKKYAYEIHGNIRAAMEGSKYQRLVIAQNRKVPDGILMELEKEMVNDPNTKIHVINVMDKKGMPTWPERYDEEGINALQTKYTPRAFMSEFMNQPTAEGGIFKPEWVHYGKAGSWRSFPCLFLHWDLSYSDQGDFKAGVLVGVKDHKIYVLDIFCRKTDVESAMHYHYDIVEKCKLLGVPLMASFDSTASQLAVFTPVWQNVAKARQIFEMPMPRQAPKSDKHLRVEATLTPLMMHGKVIFDEKLKDTPDEKSAQHQLLTFEKGSKSHDDFPDALEEVCRKAQGNSFSAEDIANMKPVIGRSVGRKGNKRGKKSAF